MSKSRGHKFNHGPTPDHREKLNEAKQLLKGEEVMEKVWENHGG